METTWKFYLTPEEAISGMYEACSHATASIDFEQYIFEDDLTGRRFLELLIKKAQSGVRVRLLCDAVGSHSLYSSPILAQVRARGVEVRFFNPIKPWWVHRLLNRFLRTHRKLLVTDSSVGFTGGVGIRSYPAAMRDTHVRIQGSVVAEITAAFERMWEMTGKEERSFTFSQPASGIGEFSLLTNSPHVRQRFTYRMFVKMFRAARRYLYITTPYFVPDWRLLRAIKGAARRGVDVRLMLPQSTDWKLANFANRSFYAQVLRAGARIFEYGPTFHHAKTYVVDDEWASVGSSNLDSLSLLLNYEADVMSRNKQFISELKAHFMEDLKLTREVVRAQWRKRAYMGQFLEILVKPLHRLM